MIFFVFNVLGVFYNIKWAGGRGGGLKRTRGDMYSLHPNSEGTMILAPFNE